MVKEWTAKGSAGSQSIAGVGFNPDMVLHIGTSDTTAPPHVNTSYYRISTGAMDRGGNQWSQAHYDAGGTAASWQSASTYCIIGTNTTYTSLAYEAQYTSMDSDGFTINWTACPAASYLYSLCLKGGAYQVGHWLKSASAASDTIGVANVATPTAVLTMSRDAVDSSTYITSEVWTVSASDGTNNRVAAVNATGGLGARYQYWDTTHSIYISTPGTQTATTTGTIDSFTNNSFTASYATHDAIATEILYVETPD